MNARLIPPSRLARTTVLRGQSDERLAELVRHGSAAAFETIVHRYRRSLLSHCARVLGEADAEEAVQDALVNAHAALSGGTEIRSLRPWLHGVAHNAALGMLRRRAARPEWPQERCADRLHRPSPQPAQAELHDIVEAVQSLPSRQRDAIVMRELEGRSYEEIAGRLGASDGAVRQLLNRARRSLRDNVGALIPAGPLIRWALTADDGTGAWRVIALWGGSTVAAKLASVAALSAVSVVTALPTRPVQADGRVSSALYRGGAPGAVLVTELGSQTASLHAARSYGLGHAAPASKAPVSEAFAASPGHRGGAGQPSATRQGSVGAKLGQSGAANYAPVSGPTVRFQAGQHQAGSPAAAGGGSQLASGPAGQPGSPRAQMSGGAAVSPGRQPSPGQPG